MPQRFSRRQAKRRVPLHTAMSSATLYLTALLVAWLALVSPIAVCAFLSLFLGRGVRGHWLFVLAGPLLAYTILWLVLMLLYIPAAFAVIFLVPSTMDLLGVRPFWLPLASWVVGKEPFIAAGAAGLLSCWLATYVWPRWPGVFAALRDPPSKVH
jgi:hypothetical protein